MIDKIAPPRDPLADDDERREATEQARAVIAADSTAAKALTIVRNSHALAQAIVLYPALGQAGRR